MLSSSQPAASPAQLRRKGGRGRGKEKRRWEIKRGGVEGEERGKRVRESKSKEKRGSKYQREREKEGLTINTQCSNMQLQVTMATEDMYMYTMCLPILLRDWNSSAWCLSCT